MTVPISPLHQAFHAAAIILLLCAGTALAAEGGDGPDAVRAYAESGAVTLALQRVDSLQPVDPAAPRWGEWEQLRLQLLARLGRHDEVVQRAALLPPALTPDLRIELQAIAAGSALAQGRAALARDFAGRALWTPGITAARVRALRLLVIRSQVRDAQGDAAYGGMLRFHQDYRPLDTATATAFVDALLDLGRVQDAAMWLGALDERGAARLRLRLHAGLVSPAEAVAQARAALARSDDSAWWRVLRDAAARQPDAALRLAALEQLLDAPLLQDITAVDLREAYLDYVRRSANGYQLLAGDDAQWLEFAARRHVNEPAVARAYWAHLALEGHSPAVQSAAQLQLSASLADGRLPRAALLLYAVWPQGLPLQAETRRVLGALAEEQGKSLVALEYWRGLAAPAGQPAGLWPLRLAALALRAGRGHEVAVLLQPLLSSAAAVPAAQLPEWITLAQQCADHGLPEVAQGLYERVLPQADAAQMPAVLAGLARALDLRNRPAQAADYYLRAALRGVQTDTAAIESRLLAGINLARAGLAADARAQFEWVLRNARDPAQIRVARRELGF